MASSPRSRQCCRQLRVGRTSIPPPYKPRWTQTATDSLNELRAAAKKETGGGKSSKQKGLLKQVESTIQRLLNNPRHPSLNTHKMDSLEHPYRKDSPVFTAYVQNKTPNAYRVFWCYGPESDEITIIAITGHP